MYRQSDQACTGEDTAPYNEKLVRFREAYDCLSKESSDFLFKLIKPRLIMSGHTHHHCVTEHVLEKAPIYKSVREYSVPSFSWRNRNDPSFYLVKVPCRIQCVDMYKIIINFIESVVIIDISVFLNLSGISDAHRLSSLKMLSPKRVISLRFVRLWMFRFANLVVFTDHPTEKFMEYPIKK